MAQTARALREARKTRVETLRPNTIRELQSCVAPGVAVPFALRPRGGSTASTHCNSSPGGLVIDMSGLNRIIEIDPADLRVNVEAGVRLQDLVAALDQFDLELPGCFDLYRHTVGGAVAAPCFGAGVGDDAASLARQIVSMKVVTPSGERVVVTANDSRYMPLFRASYGLLGIIAEVCFRVRPKRTFDRTYRKLNHRELVSSMQALAEIPVGLKFYLLPHCDRAYLEILRPASEERGIHGTAWRAKDFGETVVMPSLFRSINRVVPMSSLRYRLIDGVTGLTKNLSGNRFLETGSYSVAAACRQAGESSTIPHYSTWLFSASRASRVMRDYIDFTRRVYDERGYRCDLPAAGFRVSRDPSAWLSPSRSRAMLALQTSTTRADGWEDFVIDLADFAEQHGGVPVFNQSRAVRAEYAQRVYGDALRTFISVRRQLDVDNRLLNPFLAQYFH